MPMTLEQEVAHLRVVCAERRDALIMRTAEWVRLFNFIRGPTPEEAYCLTNAMKKAKSPQHAHRGGNPSSAGRRRDRNAARIGTAMMKRIAANPGMPRSAK